jgi:cardiolipin synthase
MPEAPLSPRHIPNIISLARILLVLPVIEAILKHDFGRAIVWFTIAGLSDGVDGFLARHYGWQSRLGSFLDPVADKLLLGSSFICLAWLGVLPVWLAVLVVLRDLVIFLGAVGSYFLTEPFDGQPSRISKLNTLSQLMLVFAILLSPGILPLPTAMVQALLILVTLTTLVSGVLYVVTWGSRFFRASNSSGD